MANNKDENEEDLLNKIDSVSLNSNDIRKKAEKIENTQKGAKKKNVSKRDNIGYVDRLGVANTDRQLHQKSVSNISDSYSTSSFGGPSCPKVYEEIIQELEADIRKHIRMEHQLKLHIESVEDRIEELERDIDNKDKENGKGKNSGENNERDKINKSNPDFQKEIKVIREKHLKDLTCV